MTEECDICGRTRQEAENLKEKRSDIDQALAEVDGITKCGSCLGNQFMGELSQDEQLKRRRSEMELVKEQDEMYNSVNKQTLQSV